MNTELLAFTARENFDFFKFDSSRISGVLSDEAKDELKASCNRILEHAHKAVKDMCCWGYELAKLRDSGRWKFVVNPENGMRFLYSSFEKFCEYAFGFSGTHTSNLLGISQFLYEKDGKLEFYNERYNDFNMSQLVELSSVERYRWPLFTSKMSVKSMRLAKKFLAVKGSSVGITSENLLSLAQDWETALNDLNTPSKGDVQEELDLPDENEVEDGAETEQEESGAVVELTEEQREKYITRSLLAKSFEFRDKIKDFYLSNPMNSEFVSFIKEQYGLSGFSLCGEPYSVRCSAKGYVLSGSGGANFDILLSWSQVAERIVAFINRGEYVTSEEIAEHLDVPTFIDVVGESETDDIEDVDEPEECLDEEEEEYEEKSEMEEETVRNAYDFSTREGVRTFLNSWERWMCYSTSGNGMFFGFMCRYFVFKNRVRLFALQQRVCSTVDEDFKSEICVRYFIEIDEMDYELGKSSTYVLMSKSQLEKYIALHKDEL